MFEGWSMGKIQSKTPYVFSLNDKKGKKYYNRLLALFEGERQLSYQRGLRDGLKKDLENSQAWKDLAIDIYKKSKHSQLAKAMKGNK